MDVRATLKGEARQLPLKRLFNIPPEPPLFSACPWE
uniref:Uncharacterized protein n=1 Tax=Anguilla anguilla TaxID=7936 RepID=A0A0E9S601_ANGAN